MTVSTQAAARTASAGILRRYYLAMAAPFVVDLVSLIAYVAINRAPESLASLVTVSAAFLLVGTGIGAYFLIRPVARFIVGRGDLRRDRASPLPPAAQFGDPRRLLLCAHGCPAADLAAVRHHLRRHARHRGLDRRRLHLRGLYRLQRRADLLRGQRLPRSPVRAPVRDPRRQSRHLPRPLSSQGGLCPDLRVLRRHDPAGRRHRELRRRPG